MAGTKLTGTTWQAAWLFRAKLHKHVYNFKKLVDYPKAMVILRTMSCQSFWEIPINIVQELNRKVERASIRTRL